MKLLSSTRLLICCCLAFTVQIFGGWGSLVYGQAWTPKAPMPTPRAYFAGGVAAGVFYAVGGFNTSISAIHLDTLEAYNPATDSWTSRAVMPTPRSFLAAAVADGKLFAIGGENLVSSSLSTVEAYDPSSNTWHGRAPMPTPRSGAAAALLDGLIYVVGGNNSGFLSTVEAYDPKTNSWSVKASMPTARAYAAVAVVGSRLYVVGGQNFSSHLPTLEAYDPGTNSWSAKAPMPTSRGGLTAATIDDLIYVAGGFGPSDESNAVQVYDPRSNTWTSRPTLPTARQGLVAAVTGNDSLYVVGGIDPPRIFGVNEAFSPFLSVAIDIKPGDPNNTVNLKSNANVTVAILGSATLGAANIDPGSVTLAGAAATAKGNGAMFKLLDVNRDGFIDLLVDFRARDLQLTAADTEAVLKATTFAGQRIRGVDAVRIVK